MTLSTRRQRQERKQNQRRRERLLAKRAAKMETAHFCYEQAKFYWENENLPGVVYWEHQYKEANAKI